MLEHAPIVREHGRSCAAVPGLGLTVHSADTGALFKRRAQRTNGANECWLVGELDGVRCYVTRKEGAVSVVMTTDDLYPDP